MWEAIIGILGSLASTMLNKYQNDASIARMNEYNSPKSQLARYSEAGLSPANVYSQGASAGTQNLIGNYQTSLGSDVVSSIMGASQLRQQKQLQQHQLQLIDAQANNQNAEAALKLLEADWLPDEKKAQIANVISDTLLKNSQKNKTDEETRYTSSLRQFVETQNLHELEKIGVTKQQLNNLIAEEERIWAELDSITYDTSQIKPQQAKLIKAQIAWYGKLGEEIDSKIGLNDAQADSIRSLQSHLEAYYDALATNNLEAAKKAAQDVKESIKRAEDLVQQAKLHRNQASLTQKQELTESKRSLYFQTRIDNMKVLFKDPGKSDNIY